MFTSTPSLTTFQKTMSHLDELLAGYHEARARGCARDRSAIERDLLVCKAFGERGRLLGELAIAIARAMVGGSPDSLERYPSGVTPTSSPDLYLARQVDVYSRTPRSRQTNRT